MSKEKSLQLMTHVSSWASKVGPQCKPTGRFFTIFSGCLGGNKLCDRSEVLFMHIVLSVLRHSGPPHRFMTLI